MADKVTIEFGHGKKKKRPDKNKDGAQKKPSANPDGGAAPQLSPSAAPGGVNPLTHPGAPQMTVNAQAPIQDPAGKQSVLQPTPTQDTRQVRHNVNFKDLPPAGQMGLMEQQGLDPMAPMKMLQQSTDQAMAQGPTQPGSPVPNALIGPGVPPGIESLPDDIAHLQQLMEQGYAPGASPAEGALAQNADAIMRAKGSIQKSQSLAPVAPPSPLAPSPNMGMAPQPGNMGIAPPPGNGSAMPPQAPGAPGGIPPEIIAALAAEAKKKHPPR